MEVPALANKRLIDLAKELIEVRFQDRHAAFGRDQEDQENLGLDPEAR
jgi:hypothetical protein